MKATIIIAVIALVVLVVHFHNQRAVPVTKQTLEFPVAGSLTGGEILTNDGEGHLLWKHFRLDGTTDRCYESEHFIEVECPK